MTVSGPRSILLIGLSGAGKSTVAQQLASVLGTKWCDVDHTIELRAGKTISEIFASEGEAHFRALEAEAIEAALDDLPQVIAAGAGWAAQAGALETVRRRALVVHLVVDPAVAARRLASAGDRPLLGSKPSVAQLREQLATRLPAYQMADIEVAADFGAPDVVAAGVAVAARQYGGWASY